MKTLNILLAYIIFSSLTAGNLRAQQPAVIKVDLDRQIGTVDPKIYGAFVEPIRRIVYGTIYDPESPLADKSGFRQDFIELVKQLHIPVIRWPGGNFVSGYNWEDGIGPKDKRPARFDLAWKEIETNQMGTDEYVKFCGLIGAENFICINAGLGTVKQALHWLEYCNFPGNSTYANLRRKYGHEAPFAVKYWALGNEIDGVWELGRKSKEDYCKFALEAAKDMQLMDTNIKLIASGASDYRPAADWVGWNEYVLQHLAGHIDYLSVHRYAREALNGDRSYSGTISLGLDIDEKINVVKGLIKAAMVKTGTQRPVYISFDEWSGGRNNLTGALVLAEHLNSFIRHADIVKMANMTMLTSLVGTSPDGDFKNALYLPFYLYSNNSRGTSLDVYCDSETYSNKVFNDIPYLDVTAVLNHDSNTVVVNVVNRHETKALSAEVVLQSGEFAGEATIHEINGSTVLATNTKTQQGVTIANKDIKFHGNKISYSFPAHSLTQMLISLK